ncbi:MAG TPA: hypothetical protein P5572_10750 [Phycisphaerae bacterium]|nr:hypothetical protein [Phycisphaerae bacterium]
MRRWAFALVPLAACGPAALGQDAPRPRGPALPPLAQYVPDDAGLFVEIDGLLDNSLLLREQHIWPVIERLLGAEDPDGGWPAALATNLGADSTASMVQLFRQRVALAAPNWQNLGEGIIVFTNASPRAMSAFFRRAGSDPVETRGQVRLYRSRGGMWIANLGPTVVLGRARGPQTMFDRATALLAEPGAKSLVAAESFRTCLADLQGPHLIWAYWSTPGPSAEAGGGLTDWWPALRQGALAVRARDNTLQIALRGLRDADAETPYQPRVRLERLLTLPQLTLAAWATSIDARELYTAARAADPPREYAHLSAADGAGGRRHVCGPGDREGRSALHRVFFGEFPVAEARAATGVADRIGGCAGGGGGVAGACAAVGGIGVGGCEFPGRRGGLHGCGGTHADVAARREWRHARGADGAGRRAGGGCSGRMGGAGDVAGPDF